MKNFDFDNDTRKNIFSHSYMYYMVSKDYKERNNLEEQLHSKNYFLEMSLFHAKMRLKEYTTNTKLFNGKSYIKNLYTRL